MNALRYVVAAMALILFAGFGTATDSMSQIFPFPNSGNATAMVVKVEDEGYEIPEDVVADAIHEAGVSIMASIDHYKEGSLTPQELSRSADEIMSDHLREPALRQALPQLVSHVTLKALLESRAATDIKPDIVIWQPYEVLPSYTKNEGVHPYIARHAEILVDNKSPHAKTIARALKALDGYWPEDKIRDVASRAISNAKSYLARTNHIPLLSDPDHVNEPEGHIDIRQGIRSLERYLEGIDSRGVDAND